MALPTEWFVSAANGVFGQWLGHAYLGLQGSIHPYYVMSALYLIVFSIGEAFYSPRVYEYAAAIAPPGQEASYGSLAYLLFLVGKLLVGTGGWLLAAFVPEQGPRDAGMVWLIFALAASVGTDRINSLSPLHSRSRSRTPGCRLGVLRTSGLEDKFRFERKRTRSCLNSCSPSDYSQSRRRLPVWSALRIRAGKTH
jgi:hypothetical protein